MVEVSRRLRQFPQAESKTDVARAGPKVNSPPGDNGVNYLR